MFSSILHPEERHHFCQGDICLFTKILRTRAQPLDYDTKIVQKERQTPNNILDECPKLQNREAILHYKKNCEIFHKMVTW